MGTELTPRTWYVWYGMVTASRTCSALVVPVTALYAASENVPDTALLAPVPRAEQLAYAAVAPARRRVVAPSRVRTDIVVRRKREREVYV